MFLNPFYFLFHFSQDAEMDLAHLHGETQLFNDGSNDLFKADATSLHFDQV
jgi:hypothetical protein